MIAAAATQHFVMLDEPQAFDAALDRFLAPKRRP